VHGAFVADGALIDADALARTVRAARVPCIAVQGGADCVCPPQTAWALHRAWPEMELRLVANAGHSMYHPGITHELLCATDRLRELALEPADGWYEDPGGMR
jgi:proline iminopeptidase